MMLKVLAVGQHIQRNQHSLGGDTGSNSRQRVCHKRHYNAALQL